MLGGVAGNRLKTVLPRVGLVEVAAKLAHAAVGRVQVRVLKPGEHRPCLELDDARARADEGPDFLPGAGGRDAPRPHGDRVDPAPGGVHRLDGAAAQDEVGRSVAHGQTRMQEAVWWGDVAPAGRRSSGITVLHSAIAMGQRGWKRQPGGIATGSASPPGGLAGQWTGADRVGARTR